VIKKKNYISRDIDKTFSGKRLDLVLADTFSEFSRSKLKKWLESNLVFVNEKVVNKPSFKVTFPAKLELIIPDENLTEDLAERLDLKIIKSTKQYIIISKEAGMVVHPGAGNKSGTLLNALLYEYPELKKLPRAGIVHRLDKDTSGIMVVARNESGMQSLSEQISTRSIKRIYQAFTVGKIERSGKIEAPIGRHPKNRQKQAIIDSGREAISHYKVIESFGSYSHVEVSLETGRTHQIRVHMNHLGFPLIGDPLYGRRRRFAKNTHQKLREIIESFPRQALHAAQLSFIDPATSKEVTFQSNLPSDLVELRENLLNQA
jgi:23S rRNA pseudouridine1911/1915/1917 synthase|tara:strand:+ start:22 stop:975 length:954 start_codon:yes stop_codon:yes gene_type:complete